MAWKYAGGESIASIQYWNKERVDTVAGNTFSLPSMNLVAVNGGATQSTVNTGSGKDSGYVFNLNHRTETIVIKTAKKRKVKKNIKAGHDRDPLAQSTLEIKITLMAVKSIAELVVQRTTMERC